MVARTAPMMASSSSIWSSRIFRGGVPVRSVSASCGHIKRGSFDNRGGMMAPFLTSWPTPDRPSPRGPRRRSPSCAAHVGRSNAVVDVEVLGDCGE